MKITGYRKQIRHEGYLALHAGSPLLRMNDVTPQLRDNHVQRSSNINQIA